MKVRDVMMRTPAYCKPETNAGEAVELMWKHNCGILPVVDSSHRVTAVVTDRDLCVALGTRSRLPGQISVKDIANGKAHCCHADDEIQAAMETMSERQVRRLPVIREDGTLDGIVSMDNIVLHATAQGCSPEITDTEIVRTLQDIYSPRVPQLVKHAVQA